MNQTDPADIPRRAGLWAATLQERGQVDGAAVAHLTETLVASVGERLDCQDDPLLVVMLCGPTAVGKSSLINALAGADLSRPGLGATTGAALVYVHEQDDPARLFAYSQALASIELLETVLVRHRRDELLHKVLVDTPDIDSFKLQNKELTNHLVHAADLILFVTSPEKYKVMRSARWILEQRDQRAIAFVLNKWDREALGRQHDRRGEIDADFRNVLAGEGFSDAVIFKVSALAEPDGERGLAIIENELPALRAWLETGISESTASMIRKRRLQAAWGRLAAAISPMIPRSLSDHPSVPEIIERLANGGDAAVQGVGAEAAVLAQAGLDECGWPATPGLLGMWSSARHSLTSVTGSMRAGLFLLNKIGQAGLPGGGSREPASGEAPFGGRSITRLSDAVANIVRDASAAQIALGPVGAEWAADIARLERGLAILPFEVTAELTAKSNRPTLRRLAGIASIYMVEGLIVLVLIIAAGRIGLDFMEGNRMPDGRFVTVLELIFILMLIGHITATSFFPPLRQRMRRTVAQRARLLVKATAERARNTLREHLEAVDRLAEQGRDLLRLIDRTVIDLSAVAGNAAGIDRLFGQQPTLSLDPEVTGQPRAENSKLEKPLRRRPSFD